MSHTVYLFVYISLLSSAHCRVIGLLLGLWFPLHHRSWALACTPLEYPAVVLCHGNSAALSLQDQHLHMLQQITDEVDIVVNQPIVLVLNLGSCRVRLPASSPLPALPDEVSSVALASSPYVAGSKWLDHFSCFQAFRVSPLTPTPPGPAVLGCSVLGTLS